MPASIESRVGSFISLWVGGLELFFDLSLQVMKPSVDLLIPFRFVWMFSSLSESNLRSLDEELESNNFFFSAVKLVVSKDF